MIVVVGQCGRPDACLLGWLLRLWTCGGGIEIVPCSVVAHIYRSVTGTLVRDCACFMFVADCGGPVITLLCNGKLVPIVRALCGFTYSTPSWCQSA